MMKKNKKSYILIVTVIILIPLVSWIFWLIKPEKQLNVLIVNKSVTDLKRTEHLGLTWTLRHEKYVQHDRSEYNLNHEYFGFIPLEPLKSRNYSIKRLKLAEIDSIVHFNDVIFYVDNTGLLFKDWFNNTTHVKSNTRLIGGLKQTDYILLKNAVKQGKAIIAEYNFWAPPTDPLIRMKTEKLLGMEYTGWRGCYFSKLDSGKNSEVPHWIEDSYKSRFGKWDFRGPGIILINDEGEVVVLENEVHLNHPFPVINTSSQDAEFIGVSENVSFLSWFEIIKTSDVNQVISEYNLDVTLTGNDLLAMHGLDSKFPAVISHNGEFLFYYFTGDFSNIELNYFTSGFAGTYYINKWLNNSGNDKNKEFFYAYYYPIVSFILSDRHENLTIK
ncbi:MAG: hypothetical protein ACOC3S_02930 [Bacteroidota bacterium]